MFLIKLIILIDFNLYIFKTRNLTRHINLVIINNDCWLFLSKNYLILHVDEEYKSYKTLSK